MFFTILLNLGVLTTLLQELGAELLRGFVECLESEEPEDIRETEDEFFGGFCLYSEIGLYVALHCFQCEACEFLIFMLLLLTVKIVTVDDDTDLCCLNTCLHVSSAGFIKC